MRDGFTGKMAIHPNQVAVMNEVFTPSADEVAHVARRSCRCSPTTRTPARSPSRGQMVDKAHVARAERILARAKVGEAATLILNQ